ncbi:uncharacterized protein VTP21DRAFT_9865 [Calcarisporiella thermophila]|uniref:uncharacterized protein n=1 Tax=Calcarisporiella thermophila TaxID=911321 RepID=UPI0037438670
MSRLVSKTSPPIPLEKFHSSPPPPYAPPNPYYNYASTSDLTHSLTDEHPSLAQSSLPTPLPSSQERFSYGIDQKYPNAPTFETLENVPRIPPVSEDFREEHAPSAPTLVNEIPNVPLKVTDDPKHTSDVWGAPKGKRVCQFFWGGCSRKTFIIIISIVSVIIVAGVIVGALYGGYNSYCDGLNTDKQEMNPLVFDWDPVRSPYLELLLSRFSRELYATISPSSDALAHIRLTRSEASMQLTFAESGNHVRVMATSSAPSDFDFSLPFKCHKAMLHVWLPPNINNVTVEYGMSGEWVINATNVEFLKMHITDSSVSFNNAEIQAIDVASLSGEISGSLRVGNGTQRVRTDTGEQRLHMNFSSYDAVAIMGSSLSGEVSYRLSDDFTGPFEVSSTNAYVEMLTAKNISYKENFKNSKKGFHQGDGNGNASQSCSVYSEDGIARLGFFE